MNIVLKNYFSGTELQDLFESNGWNEDINKAISGLENSPHIVVAVDIDAGCKIVGIARSVDDDHWSANIDCVIVHSKYQKMGIGTMMLQQLLAQINHIDTIFVAPDEKTSASFYEANGFSVLDESRVLKKLKS